MKTFTMKIDGRFDSALNELRARIGASSRAEVVRLAVALLRVAVDAAKRDQRLAIVSEDDQVRREIVLPWVGSGSELEAQPQAVVDA